MNSYLDIRRTRSEDSQRSALSTPLLPVENDPPASPPKSPPQPDPRRPSNLTVRIAPNANSTAATTVAVAPAVGHSSGEAAPIAILDHTGKAQEILLEEMEKGGSRRHARLAWAAVVLAGVSLVGWDVAIAQRVSPPLAIFILTMTSVIAANSVGGAFAVVPNVSALWCREGAILQPLDGLRALAVLWVIAFHVTSQENGFMSEALPGYGRFERTILVQAIQGGNMGVDLFFVLSGFLIAHLLLREWARSGTVNVARFLWRRWLRIFPVYLVGVVLDVVVGFDWSAEERSTCVHEGWSNLLFLNNYINQWRCLMHTWSIAVEFQFYLISPLLIWLTMARKVPMWFITLVLTACSLALRWYFMEMHGFDGCGKYVYDKVYTRMPPYLAGMTAARLFASGGCEAWRAHRSYRRWAGHLLAAAVWASITYIGPDAEAHFLARYEVAHRMTYVCARSLLGFAVAYLMLMTLWGKARLLRW
ncbi:hypothetical protein CYMTET_27519 [Cymbomonas tetramitiformis]|uniref:Acyltransferase 3 domain-containing protein n=1 Tax=Cymbomonas tetramitiformis TaxID=36881 RepID=A0AAE0FPN3_9CHLO|nr:hypothetical protein CYMTET_27519 [Cymbomonas tetramitiformis]